MNKIISFAFGVAAAGAAFRIAERRGKVMRTHRAFERLLTYGPSAAGHTYPAGFRRHPSFYDQDER